MATQRDVQQLIQGLTPSAVNNGNPNTIYNTSPFAVSPAARRQAMVLPPPSASLTGWVPPQGGTGGPPITGPILPQMPPLGPPNGGGGTPPVTVQPPVEPPVGPPVGDPDGGGGTRPGFPEDILGFDPDRRPRTVQTGPFGWGHDVRQPGFGTNFGGSSRNSGSGTFNWKQLLDMITEPFVPGDHYLENSGELSKGNLIKGLLDSLAPGAGMLGEAIFSRTNPDAYFDHLMQIANDKMIGNQNEVNDATNKAVADNIQKILDEMFGGAATSTGRGGYSSQAAGATTIAEGLAAQNMVGDMQLQYFLNALKRQAEAVMNPRYKYER